MKQEILSIIGTIIVAITLVILVFKGVFFVSDISSALAWVLVALIPAMLFWGFKPRIERIFRRKSYEKDTAFKQTKKGLLKTLRFFPDHWETYKKLIESRKLQFPQSNEVKQCSDQIKSAIARVHLLNLNKINAIIPQIEAISNDMALFGIAVQRFPHHVGFWMSDGKDVIIEYISRGNVLYEKVKQTISLVEQVFK